jgi:hypothetical protein
MAINYSELNAVIVQHIDDPKTWDGLAKRNPFMSWLMGDGKEHVKGSINIQTPIKLIKNASSAFISGTSAVVDTNPSIQLQYMTHNWKYYNFNVNFTLQDFNQVGGDTEKVNFMAKKTEGALNDSIRELSSAFHIGTYSAAGGTINTYPLKPNGLLEVTVASGTAYGALTDTDYTDDTTAFLPLIETTTIPNYTNINQGINKLKGRTAKELDPSGFMGLMNPVTYSKFQSSVQNQQVFTKPSTFNVGSEGFNVNGVDFMLDSDVPGTQNGSTGDNYIYVFPKEIMRMVYNFGFGNKSPFDGEVRLPNQPIQSIQHYMSMNLICSMRRLVLVWKVMVA